MEECYSRVYAKLEEHARTGECELLDEVGRSLLECPEWSLLSLYLSYSNLCKRLPEFTLKVYSALKLFIESLDCEALERGYRLACYSVKRLIYYVEPKMKDITPGERWLLENILNGMSGEKLVHSICKAYGIISYPEGS